jgi:hypothetical protein
MKKNKRMIKAIYNVLLKTGFEDAYILKVYQDEHLHVNLKIPPQKDLSDLMDILPNLKQELYSLDVKLGVSQWKVCGIDLWNEPDRRCSLHG